VRIAYHQEGLAVGCRWRAVVAIAIAPCRRERRRGRRGRRKWNDF